MLWLLALAPIVIAAVGVGIRDALRRRAIRARREARAWAEFS